MVGIGSSRRLAKPCRPADDRLIDVFPRLLRLHECLVVKARHKQRRQQIINLADIIRQRRPPVLALRDQPVMQFNLRSPEIGRVASAAPINADKRIRLFRPRRDQPARAVIFERASHQMNAIREQARGERITLEGAIKLPVKAETQRLFPVDPAALCGAKREAHRPASFIRVPKSGFFSPAG